MGRRGSHLGQDFERKLTRLLDEEERTFLAYGLLVTEVAAAGEDHRSTGGSHRFDDLVISLRPARLDDPGDSRFEGCLRPVGKREERI